MQLVTEQSAGDQRWQILGVVLTSIVVGIIFWFAADVFLLLFIGLLLAVFLDKLARLLSGWTSLGHGWSLAVVLVVMATLFAGAGALFSYRIADEMDGIKKDLQSAWQQLEKQSGKYEWSKQLVTQSNLSQLESLKGNWISRITGLFSTTIGIVGSCLLVVFIGIYTAANPGLYQRGFLHLIPLNYRGRTQGVLREIGTSLRWWIMGQLVSMTCIAIATAGGLWLLGIPNAMTLGLLAGVLTFIPNFGPIAAAIPAILLGFTVGTYEALYVLLLYVGVQAVESNLLTPLVQQKSVDLPPVLVVIVQVLMGTLFGIQGLIVAAPLTVCCMIVAKRMYVEDVLDDSLNDADTKQ